MTGTPPEATEGAAGRILVVDGGRTASRVAVFEDGRLVASESAPGLPYRSGGSLQPVLEALSAGLARIADRAPFDVAVLGLASIETPELAAAVDGHVRSLIDVHRVVVSVDAVTNHVGALGLRPGTVVAAGTGVIALGIGADGRSARADGWGYILGDDGSGYQIGRRGLASALREVDGRGGSALLRAKAQERFGDLEGLSVTVYAAPNPVGLVASFSTDVAEAACDGDAIARAIWEDAAAEIARTALAVTSRVFEAAAVVTVSWTGGLFAEEELLLEPFRAQVAREWPAAQLCPPRADALMGGLLLARSDLPRSFEGLVYRFNAQKEAGRMR